MLLILEGAVGYSGDVPASDRPHSETATYVNIPVSPTSKKQLHYMELELQEPSTSIRGKEVYSTIGTAKEVVMRTLVGISVSCLPIGSC